MEQRYDALLSLHGIPSVTPEEMQKKLQNLLQQGWRLGLLCVVPQARFCPNAQGLCLLALLLHEATGRYTALRTEAVERYASLTTSCPQAHWFEREIKENWGVEPEGHPWLKPIRFIPPRPEALHRDAFVRPLPGDTQYFRVDGPEVHEVAVGPVHAGVIEPGHFRFQCYGETVMHLEISLGFQHRDVETLHTQCRTSQHALRLMECVAGDTSIAHATAYALLLERLGQSPASPRGAALRSVALELERLACHTGDLGAFGGDVGFLPTLSWCGRIRGDFLNMTALLCGNRFGRGMVALGGTAHDVDLALTEELLRRLKAGHRDVRGAVDIMMQDPGVLDRFTGTGIVSLTAARDMGLVGVAGRASGLVADARHQMPPASSPPSSTSIRTASTGDVLARATVRSEEIDDSVRIIEENLQHLPEGPCAPPRAGTLPLQPLTLALAVVEGWRGPVLHLGLTDEQGQLAFHKMVDPSFHNWIGLSLALRGQEISDFPLCNKSFNLSYCGHDL